jgi:serine/threonine protein kinase
MSGDKKGLKLGGKYKIGKKLGAGAFGEVYLGMKFQIHSFYRLKFSLPRLNSLLKGYRSLVSSVARPNQRRVDDLEFLNRKRESAGVKILSKGVFDRGLERQSLFFVSKFKLIL